LIVSRNVVNFRQISVVIGPHT